MEKFRYMHAASGLQLHLRQQVQREIGFKIYPGALVLAAYLREQPLPVGTLVLELGAGVIGLPSLVLAHAGCTVVATVSNILTNSAVLHCKPPKCSRPPIARSPRYRTLLCRPAGRSCRGREVARQY
jgi:hypothetical protein